MEYEKKYNDLISRINAVKNTPKIGMKGKHHYNGYVETGIRDALDYILNPESEDERIRTRLIALVEAFCQGEYKNEMLAYLEHLQEYIDEIRQYAYNKGLVDAKEKQQPAEWSEEDEITVRTLIDFIGSEQSNIQGYGKTKSIAWLSSLPKRFNPKPKQEWGEEDKVEIKVLDSIIRYIVKVIDKDVLERFGTNYEELFSWLKSLRPQPHWKPSEEQMEILSRFNDPVLKSLYYDL